MILVGNKNDLWQDREGATDLACQVNLHFFLFFYFAILLTQEAEANGYTNYHEITTKESLDQVRHSCLRLR